MNTGSSAAVPNRSCLARIKSIRDHTHVMGEGHAIQTIQAEKDGRCYERVAFEVTKVRTSKAGDPSTSNSGPLGIRLSVTTSKPDCITNIRRNVRSPFADSWLTASIWSANTSAASRNRYSRMIHAIRAYFAACDTRLMPLNHVAPKTPGCRDGGSINPMTSAEWIPPANPIQIRDGGNDRKQNHQRNGWRLRCELLQSASAVIWSTLAGLQKSRSETCKNPSWIAGISSLLICLTRLPNNRLRYILQSVQWRHWDQLDD